MRKHLIFKSLTWVLNVVTFLVLCGISFLSAASNIKPANPDMLKKGFLKNAGQLLDMNGKLCPDVLYSFEQKNLGIFITKQGITYGFYKELSNPFSDKKISKFDTDRNYTKSFDIGRLDCFLKDAKILKENCIEVSKIEDAGKINFYGGGLTEECLNLQYVSELLFTDIYPGIDWRIIISEKTGFKYDFILHPNADVR